jgi:hypothetical protein
MADLCGTRIELSMSMASLNKRLVAAVVSFVGLLGVVNVRAASAQDTIEMLFPRTVLAAADTAAVEARPFAIRTSMRPAPLLGLYVSLATLQALDITSTRRALNAGSVEANPLVAPFAGSTFAMTALKAGVTGATIFASERLWKKNRKAAMITMIGLNAAYGAVVSHNYRVGAAQRR